MNIKIAYFSGTGCTKYVAENFSAELTARGHVVLMERIGRGETEDNSNFDLLIICFVVHACNAPEPVLKWVKNQPEGGREPVVVISVSGGGEVTPNLACRVSLKRRLAKQKYSVLYEKMIVMPSNWIVGTKDVLIDQLMEVLPYKVSHIVDEVLNGKKRIIHPLPGNRLLSLLGNVEHYGAPEFGKKIFVNGNCTACGICVNGCPVGNISLISGKISYGRNCVLCLNCLYSCPQNALTPRRFSFILVKEGFSFKEILKREKKSAKPDIMSETKGYLWLGVRRYLMRTDDMTEPMGKL